MSTLRFPTPTLLPWLEAVRECAVPRGYFFPHLAPRLSVAAKLSIARIHRVQESLPSVAFESSREHVLKGSPFPGSDRLDGFVHPAGNADRGRFHVYILVD